MTRRRQQEYRIQVTYRHYIFIVAASTLSLHADSKHCSRDAASCIADVTGSHRDYLVESEEIGHWHFSKRLKILPKGTSITTGLTCRNSNNSTRTPLPTQLRTGWQTTNLSHIKLWSEAASSGTRLSCITSRVDHTSEGSKWTSELLMKGSSPSCLLYHWRASALLR